MNVAEDALPPPPGPSPASPPARDCGRKAHAVLRVFTVVVVVALGIAVSALWAEAARSKCDELARALERKGDEPPASYLIVGDAERLLGSASPDSAHAEGRKRLAFVLECRSHDEADVERAAAIFNRHFPPSTPPVSPVAMSRPIPLTLYLAIDLSTSVFDPAKASEPLERTKTVVEEVRKALAATHHDTVLVPVFFADRAQTFRAIQVPLIGGSLVNLQGALPGIVAGASILDLGHDPKQGIERLQRRKTDFSALWREISEHQSQTGQAGPRPRLHRMALLVVTDGEHSPNGDTVEELPALPRDFERWWLMTVIVADKPQGKRTRQSWEKKAATMGPRFQYLDVSSAVSADIAREVGNALKQLQEAWMVRLKPQDDSREVSTQRRVKFTLEVILDHGPGPYRLVLEKAKLVPLKPNAKKLPITEIEPIALTTPAGMGLERGRVQRIVVKGFAPDDPDARAGFTVEYAYRLLLDKSKPETLVDQQDIETSRETPFESAIRLKVGYYDKVLTQWWSSGTSRSRSSSASAWFGPQSLSVPVRFSGVASSYHMFWVTRQLEDGTIPIQGGPYERGRIVRRAEDFVVDGDQTLVLDVEVRRQGESRLMGNVIKWLAYNAEGKTPGGEATTVRIAVLHGVPAVISSVSWALLCLLVVNAFLQWSLLRFPSLRSKSWLRWIDVHGGSRYRALMGIGDNGVRFTQRGVWLAGGAAICHVGPLAWAFWDRWPLWKDCVNLYYIGTIAVSVMVYGLIALWRRWSSDPAAARNVVDNYVATPAFAFFGSFLRSDQMPASITSAVEGYIDPSLIGPGVFGLVGPVVVFFVLHRLSGKQL